jgi:hypothetical protein
MTEPGTRGDPAAGQGEGQGKLDDAKAQAQEQAQRATQQARGRVREVVDQRSTQAGEQVEQQASDIRTVAEQLREQGKEGPAKVAEQAAERAERLGSYLRERDADTLLDDAERMMRDNAWAVMAGGVAIGFAASRFLKASSRQRFERSGDQRMLPRTTTEPRFETPGRPMTPPNTGDLSSGAPSTGAPVGSP